MESVASLRQTVTHLFDAVRYSNRAKELEVSAVAAERKMEVELSKLDDQTGAIASQIDAMKGESSYELKELSRQLDEFLETAKGMARDKIEKSAKTELEDIRRRAGSERDKALKALEAFLASDPLPVTDFLVQVRLAEGVYEARSRYECDGGIRYDFRLASQESRLFRQELVLSEFGYELKVPVRLSRAILKKQMVPGFERLDQYILSNAETSGGKITANFKKAGNGANLKIVTSGSGENDFLGLEYTDGAEAVNVMNDPSLGSYLDLTGFRSAAALITGELDEMSKKKVALLKLTIHGEDPLVVLDYQKVLETVLEVLGPSFRDVVNKLAKSPSPSGPVPNGTMTLGFIQERLKVLGSTGPKIAAQLGVPAPIIG